MEFNKPFRATVKIKEIERTWYYVYKDESKKSFYIRMFRSKNNRPIEPKQEITLMAVPSSNGVQYIHDPYDQLQIIYGKDAVVSFVYKGMFENQQTHEKAYRLFDENLIFTYRYWGQLPPSITPREGEKMDLRIRFHPQKHEVELLDPRDVRDTSNVTSGDTPITDDEKEVDQSSWFGPNHIFNCLGYDVVQKKELCDDVLDECRYSDRHLAKNVYSLLKAHDKEWVKYYLSYIQQFYLLTHASQVAAFANLIIDLESYLCEDSDYLDSFSDQYRNKFISKANYVISYYTEVKEALSMLGNMPEMTGLLSKIVGSLERNGQLLQSEKRAATLTLLVKYGAGAILAECPTLLVRAVEKMSDAGCLTEDQLTAICSELNKQVLINKNLSDYARTISAIMIALLLDDGEINGKNVLVKSIILRSLSFCCSKDAAQKLIKEWCDVLSGVATQSVVACSWDILNSLLETAGDDQRFADVVNHVYQNATSYVFDANSILTVNTDQFGTAYSRDLSKEILALIDFSINNLDISDDIKLQMLSLAISKSEFVSDTIKSFEYQDAKLALEKEFEERLSKAENEVLEEKKAALAEEWNEAKDRLKSLGVSDKTLAALNEDMMSALAKVSKTDEEKTAEIPSVQESCRDKEGRLMIKVGNNIVARKQGEQVDQNLLMYSPFVNANINNPELREYGNSIFVFVSRNDYEQSINTNTEYEIGPFPNEYNICPLLQKLISGNADIYVFIKYSGSVLAFDKVQFVAKRDIIRAMMTVSYYVTVRSII